MHELNILLKIEFRRAFKNKLFAASIVIGLALAAGAFIQTVVPHIDVLGGYDGSVASYPHSVFTSWMGIGIGYDIWATVYLYVCILLAALQQNIKEQITYCKVHNNFRSWRIDCRNSITC